VTTIEAVDNSSNANAPKADVASTTSVSESPLDPVVEPRQLAMACNFQSAPRRDAWQTLTTMLAPVPPDNKIPICEYRSRHSAFSSTAEHLRLDRVFSKLVLLFATEKLACLRI
jgi:hypothetical protein